MLTNVRVGLVLASALAMAGCGALYVAQAARGQMQVLNARRPIERLLEDPKTSQELRQRLVSVRAARAFAVRELGMPDNESYTTYADLQRPYVVWSVVATPEFSVEPREWCFPIVGCVAYRGYFSEARAEKFAAALRARGNDVIIGGIAAYSTLGKFSDPILNTMLGYGEDELAAILFHELSHQLVYIADDTAFNEAFAVTVEHEGLARWLAAQGRSAELANYQARRRRQAQIVGVVAGYRERLEALYRQPISTEAMRTRKAEVFGELLAELEALDKVHGSRSAFTAEVGRGPNNARLASLATYYDCVPGFERLLERQERDLPRFYAAVRELAKLSRAARRAELCASVDGP